MPTDIIQSVTSIIQTIAVVISLFYVSRQIGDGAKAVKSQTYQSIISAYAEIESRISQNTETAKIYYTGRHHPEKLTQEEEIIFEQLMCSIFNFFENLYYQNKNGLLENHLWAGWCNLMRVRLAEIGVKEYWDKSEYLYSKDFCEYVRSGKCPRN